jgi:hypothetical protein
MKTLVYILTILLLSSCSTSNKAKPCDSCPHFSYVYYDTTILTIPHYNYNGMCFPESRIVIIEEEELIIEQL